jgi:chromosome segregation ATPase
MKAASLKRGFRQAIFPMMLFLASATARAGCSFVANDNARLASKLEELQGHIEQFELDLAATEKACQKEQAQIAASGANAATAESCIALGEDEALNRKLSGSSDSCAKKTTILETALDAFTTTTVAPFSSAMDTIVMMQNIARKALPECSQEFANGREIQGQAQEALGTAKAKIAKAKDDISKFKALKAQTDSFAAATGKGSWPTRFQEKSNP